MAQLTLQALRAEIEARPGITTQKLCWHFKVSELLMDSMLECLQGRGDIEEVTLMPTCGAHCSGGCSSTDGTGTGWRRARAMPARTPCACAR